MKKRPSFRYGLLAAGFVRLPPSSNGKQVFSRHYSSPFLPALSFLFCYCICLVLPVQAIHPDGSPNYIPFDYRSLKSRLGIID